MKILLIPNFSFITKVKHIFRMSCKHSLKPGLEISTTPLGQNGYYQL